MGSQKQRSIRVMQSFGAPRPTSNPYVHMLDAALAETPGVEHIRFDRRLALLGHYDILHFHWPETMLGGSTVLRRIARRAFAMALAMRLSVSRVAVVRTAHNIALPTDVSPWERRYLAWIERRVDHRIVLNEHTAVPEGTTATLIKHGHYRDWFAAVPELPASPDTIAFVGLVRRYKGVEELLDSFASTSTSAPELRLHIAGNPTSAAIEREVRARADADRRVSLDLHYLSEADFANAVMQSIGVVLPYRAMHNSGSVLAALSLDRPVLVPRNDVAEALAAEVGHGWVHCFDGRLTGESLERFARAASDPPTVAPDLTDRAWDRAGVAHRGAFQLALAHRRATHL